MDYFHIESKPPLRTNTFLLITKNKKAVVIDPDASVSEYERFLNAKKAQLTHILLTHGHHDHVASAKELSEKYGATIYLGEGDCTGNRLFPLNSSDVTFYSGDEDMAIDEDCVLKIIATPGHSKGCVCILHEKENLLFSGDTLFANDVGRCDLEGSSYKEMLKSLKKLSGIVKDSVKVMPGHGEFSNFGYEKQTNEYFSK